MKRLILLLLPALLCMEISQAQHAPAQRPWLDYVVVPEGGSWDFVAGEPGALRIIARGGGNPLDGVEVTFQAGGDKMPADTAGRARFVNGEATIRFGTMPVPGFRACWFEFTVEGKRCEEMVKAAFSPEKIMPTVIMPDDFQSFWNDAKKEAARVPMTTEITPLPEHSTETVDVSLVKIACWPEGHAIYGYLSRPKAPGKYPVVLSPPGAGVKRFGASTGLAEAGFITLSIEIHGLSPMAPDTEFIPAAARIGEYSRTGMESRDSFYYKKVYLSCVRAMDFLCSLPQWDRVNAAASGGSQGGALAIVAAGLDPRVKFLTAFYPALCDMTGYLHGRAGGWPNYFAADDEDGLPVPVETAVETLKYYDVVNFARTLTVPGFYSHGYCDNTCPPTPVTAALNAIRAPKTIETTPASAHWRFPETNRRATEWMKEQVKR